MSIDFQALCRKKELTQTQTLNGDLFAMSGVLVLLPTLHVIMTHECPHNLHDAHACMNVIFEASDTSHACRSAALSSALPPMARPLHAGENGAPRKNCADGGYTAGLQRCRASAALPARSHMSRESVIFTAFTPLEKLSQQIETRLRSNSMKCPGT